ncbi:MAG TPA: phosphorylated adapter RNA export RNA-binding domain-containing protein [Herpetosiphonaceae bacterium]
MHQDHQTNEPLADTIAAQLGETALEPIAQIQRAVAILGPDTVLAVLDETQRIEAQGGLLRQDGQRRTPGGVFFHLLTARVAPAIRRQIFPKVRSARPPRPARPEDADRVLSRSPKPLQVSQFPKILAQLAAHFAVATDVTITLRGKPVQIVERGDLVVLAVLAPAAPALDPALPKPPTRTDCLVVLTRAQWTPLARQFSRARDQVSVAGYPVFDPRHAGITILTTEIHLRKGRKLPARRDLRNWDEDLS